MAGTYELREPADQRRRWLGGPRGPTDVERFLLDQDLDRTASRDFDLHRLAPVLGTGGAAVRFGAELAANSGRWVKLTAESAGAVKKYGLTATKTPGVSHAMVGKPGEIKPATFDQAAGALRAVDVDGDGIPDKPRALVVAEDAGSAIKGAAAGAAGAIGVGASTAGSAVGGLAAGGANAVRSLLRRKQSTAASPDGLVPKATDPPPGSPDA